MTSLLTRLPPPRRSAGADDTFDRTLIAPIILGSILNPVNSSMIAVALVPPTLDDRTALVLIDLQNGIMAAPTAPHTTADVLARAVELADAFHTHDLPVVLVRVAAADNGADAPPGRTEIRSRGGARPAGWDLIVGDLAGHPDDITVTKRSWRAFHDTGGEAPLRSTDVFADLRGVVRASPDPSEGFSYPAVPIRRPGEGWPSTPAGDLGQASVRCLAGWVLLRWEFCAWREDRD